MSHLAPQPWPADTVPAGGLVREAFGSSAMGPATQEQAPLPGSSSIRLTCTNRLQPRSAPRSQPLCTPRSALQRWMGTKGRLGEPGGTVPRAHPSPARTRILRPRAACPQGLTKHHVVIRRDGRCLHRVLLDCGGGGGGQGGSCFTAGRTPLQEPLCQPAAHARSAASRDRGGCGRRQSCEQGSAQAALEPKAGGLAPVGTGQQALTPGLAILQRLGARSLLPGQKINFFLPAGNSDPPCARRERV